MYAKVLVPADRIQAPVAVPKDAVDITGSLPKVRVVDDKGVVMNRTVTLGESDDKMVQIKTGLEAGDKVVALSYTPLKDGQKVRLPGQGREGQGRRGQGK
jgi:multidrug efflux pump subunit AcrA (membrane-fusion protein)